MRAGAPCAGFAGSRGMVRTRIMRDVYICDVSSGDIMGDILIQLYSYRRTSKDQEPGEGHTLCVCHPFWRKAARGPLVLPKYTYFTLRFAHRSQPPEKIADFHGAR